MFGRTSPHKGLCLVVSAKFPARLWAQEKKKKRINKVSSLGYIHTTFKITLQIQTELGGLCLCVSVGI